MIDINAILGVVEPTVAEAGEPLTETTGVMRGDTCHIDVVDRWRNMVAATPSAGWFQSSPEVPGLGLSLSPRAQMFWLAAGLPRTLTPGRRPRPNLLQSMSVPNSRWRRNTFIVR